jgi:hypothetical protein
LRDCLTQALRSQGAAPTVNRSPRGSPPPHEKGRQNPTTAAVGRLIVCRARRGEEGTKNPASARPGATAAYRLRRVHRLNRRSVPSTIGAGNSCGVASWRAPACVIGCRRRDQTRSSERRNPGPQARCCLCSRIEAGADVSNVPSQLRSREGSGSASGPRSRLEGERTRSQARLGRCRGTRGPGPLPTWPAPVRLRSVSAAVGWRAAVAHHVAGVPSCPLGGVSMFFAGTLRGCPACSAPPVCCLDAGLDR